MPGDPLRVTLAGGCRVATFGGAWEVEVPGRQGRLVLARLAIGPGPVARDELADLVWPHSLPQAWERDLSAVISKLRRLLASAPDDVIATIRGGSGVYELVLPRGSVVDVAEAEAALDRAQGALAEGRLDAALVAARRAVDVARRPLLPGAAAVWVDERRQSLRSMLARALAVEVEVATRHHDAAGLDAADEAIATDPTSERGYANRMRLQLALGESAAALDTYERYRAAIVDELGLPPAAELEALRATARSRSEAGVPLAPSVSSGAARVGPGVLPVPATTFVGREQTLRDVDAAFETARLVTLTGPAGVGKSRLALEAARRLADQHRDGVRTCELSHLVHPIGVAAAMASALGVTAGPGGTIEETLIDALATRRMLVVVDNCEHVLPAVAPLVERIIGHCRHVYVLATSRERLAALGETVVPVEPLELPHPKADPGEAWTHPAPALELLRDRIQAVRAGFTPQQEEQAALVDVCRRLDGLPLAIELAATRMASMAPIDVARRLDRRLVVLTRGLRTAPTRHRTLRTAIELSYDLLDEPERRVFERGSVFAGGFTLAAGEHVCSGVSGLRLDDVADVIGALVDKSLLVLDYRRATTRYHMLETLREFARERLATRDDAGAAALAHAEYFVSLAEEADRNVRGPAEGEWIDALDAEVANFRVAHAWARLNRRGDLAGTLSAALTWFSFWRMRTEMFSWAEQLADAAEATMGARHSEALAAAGRGAWMGGDLGRSDLLAHQAIAAADDVSGRFGWHVLGDVALFRGALDRANSAYEQADRLASRAGDAYHCALLRGCRALVRSYAGDEAAAIELAAESRAEARACGNPTAEAWSAYVTGEILLASDPDLALVHLERAGVIADAVSNEFVRGVAGLSATSLLARHGPPNEAARAFVEVIDRFEKGGNWRQQWTTIRLAAELLARLERHHAAAVVLGAVESADGENIFGDDAERLAGLRAELSAVLGLSLAPALRDGQARDRTDIVAFTRDRLLAP
jgi:predicted ATPase/DNA-binding SARP family transcriptional activator